MRLNVSAVNRNQKIVSFDGMTLLPAKKFFQENFFQELSTRPFL